MSVNDKKRQTVLIVDDNEINRETLSEMLCDKYDIILAENGQIAIDRLAEDHHAISLILLDIIMPVKDGYDVLKAMNETGWIRDVPVIMISSEDSSESMQLAYDLGINEFIRKPFDTQIVRHRVINTLRLYAKQDELYAKIQYHMHEREKDSRLMINILSHIVEFRNGESGMHVLHVQKYTEILTRQLIEIDPKYNMKEEDIAIISKASALHDIGKISISDNILNKPGRLTDEEFSIMKQHSMAGASMLEELTLYQDEPLVKVAYEICRWHHERYDGRGYPDGLAGDDIPISAQIVAMADVYDALTSERVYKAAFSHEKAIDMITNNECGVFNPLLIECLIKAQDKIYNVVHGPQEALISDSEIRKVSDDVVYGANEPEEKDIASMLEFESMRNEFYARTSDDIHFEYMVSPAMVTIYPNKSGIPARKEMIIDPAKDKRFLSVISFDDFKALTDKGYSASESDPYIYHDCNVVIGGSLHHVNIVYRPVWDKKGNIMGAIGKATDLGPCAL